MKSVDLYQKSLSFIILFLTLCVLLLSLASFLATAFGQSVFGIDPFIRHLVFLNMFFGGLMAIEKGQHISIDALLRILKEKKWNVLEQTLYWIIDLFSTLVCLTLCYQSFLYWQTELDTPKDVWLGLSHTFFLFFIPLSFFIMALRFLLKKKGASSPTVLVK